MKQKIYQVDAFTDKVFQGNPASVCPLEVWLSDELMQLLQKEIRLILCHAGLVLNQAWMKIL